MVRPLASHQCAPGLTPGMRYLWVKFVGSILTDSLCSRYVQGWRSVESTPLPLMCPRFDSQTQRHIWMSLLVLYSAPRGFLRVLRFPLSSKFDFICVDCSFQFTVSPISSPALERLDT